MRKIVLANSNYGEHMTDEGNQLQLGLMHSGWTLSGRDYDGIPDVQTMLDKYNPDIVYVQDQRDWDCHSPGAFADRSIMWRNITALRDHRCYVVGVCKDAGSAQKRQEKYLNKQGCNAVVHYYHTETVLKLSPYVSKYKLIRTYHSIDKDVLPEIRTDKQGVVISGARCPNVYPLREALYNRGVRQGWTLHKHPGYGRKGCCVKDYYDVLNRHKVSIATASIYDFALRKIIESTAMGCITVTNLSYKDPLPYIDDCVCYIDDSISPKKIQDKINDLSCVGQKPLDIKSANKCREYYDYRNIGKMLDKKIVEVCNERD